jgi:aminocarboxymuconate-semialdehyde decarboxylase
MTAADTIDVHAHILDLETIDILQKETPKAGFKLTRIDDESGTLDFGGRVVTPFPRGGWDLERRLRDMDTGGFDMQVLSICPFTFCYWLEPELTLAVSQIQNNQIAALAKRMPDRFLGLATLPMQAPKLAADELRRAMTKLGMRGVQIGSMVNGRNLDDPALEPVWATAAELGAFILVHPMNAVGVPGVESY